MQAADIRQDKGRRRGTHIFRHHMVITMLSNGIPQPVITRTLGHTAPESLSPYLHADMKHLRECALSLDEFPVSKEVFQSCMK
jgi:site-specific recombinase XerD